MSRLVVEEDAKRTRYFVEGPPAEIVHRRWLWKLVNAWRLAALEQKAERAAEELVAEEAKETAQMANMRFAEVLQRGGALPLHEQCSLSPLGFLQEEN